MKKVSELTGAELDCWVARAAGLSNAKLRRVGPTENGGFVFVEHVQADGNALYSPSSDWKHGGPIIEREDLLLAKMNDIWHAISPALGDSGYWGAGYVDIYADSCGWKFGRGKTPLVAAMRAYVSSKYGDSVPADTQEPDQ